MKKRVIKVFWGFSKVSWGRILGAAAKLYPVKWTLGFLGIPVIQTRFQG